LVSANFHLGATGWWKETDIKQEDRRGQDKERYWEREWRPLL